MPGSIISGGDESDARIWFGLQRLEHQLQQMDTLRKDFDVKYPYSPQRSHISTHETGDGSVTITIVVNK